MPVAPWLEKKTGSLASCRPFWLPALALEFPLLVFVYYERSPGSSPSVLLGSSPSFKRMVDTVTATFYLLL